MKQIQNKKTKTRDIERIFLPGSEWLYFKFYTGVKTADMILADLIYPLCLELIGKKMIKKWFFIRYADPENHIRVRFLLNKPGAMEFITNSVHNLVKQYEREGFIWKVQIDTYYREIERYGLKSMELSESFFYYDSEMIARMLTILRSDEGEDFKWQFALIALDRFLDDFKLDTEQKYQFVTRLQEGFGQEFGINKHLRNQLKDKFRKTRPILQNILVDQRELPEFFNQLYDLIQKRSDLVKSVVEEILSLYNTKEPNLYSLNELLASLTHMKINRLFKSKQRLHELVLYDYLSKHYKSEIAKAKYKK